MIEHKVISAETSGYGSNPESPLNPNNGNLERTLDDYAKDGWRLISYDWNTWKAAILVREFKS